MVFSGVSWSAYETLLQDGGDRLHCRVPYLDDVLELSSVSTQS